MFECPSSLHVEQMSSADPLHPSRSDLTLLERFDRVDRRVTRWMARARITVLGLAVTVSSLSAGAVCLVSALAASPALAQENPSPAAVENVLADSAMLSIATVVTENAARIDSIWPGFWSPPEFIVYRTDSLTGDPTALLYSARGPLPGYVPLEGEAVPEVLRSRTYARSGIIPEIRRFQDRDSDLPFVLDLDGAPGSGVLSLIDVLLHESFHRWQEHAFERERSCVLQWYPRSLPLADGFRDAIAAELSLLKRAVLEEDDSRAATRASDYLESRRRRLAGVLPLVTHIEDRQALWEGTARFVGNAGSLVARQRSLDALPDALADALDRLRARALDPALSPVAEQGARMYGAGAAVAYLLERLGAPGWRLAAQQGRPLDELLAEHIGSREYLAWSDSLPGPEQSCEDAHPRR